MKGKTFFSLVTGIAAGAILGVLLAPEKGSETRKRVRAKLEEWEKAFAEEDPVQEAAEESQVSE